MKERTIPGRDECQHLVKMIYEVLRYGHEHGFLLSEVGITFAMTAAKVSGRDPEEVVEYYEAMMALSDQLEQMSAQAFLANAGESVA